MSEGFPERQVNDDGMLPECDFSRGVRGKHSELYQRGYQVIVLKENGTTEVREFALPEGTIILDPDIRAYFPDSETVNRTLRELINLIPQPQASDQATS